VQFIGVVATFAYTAIATYIILKVVGMMVGLRVSPEEEQQGLHLPSMYLKYHPHHALEIHPVNRQFLISA
jgi:ammonia channel protein AmtB